jgi:phospholipase/carboxylesterase
VTYDQADLRSESEAFAAFVAGAVTTYALDTERLVFLGYSNGASFLAAVIALQPGVAHRAILLRGIQALETLEAADLSGTRVLMLDGRDDPFACDASTLAEDLRGRGADVESRTLAVGHDLSGADVTEAARWTGQNLPRAALVAGSDPSA